MPSRKTQGRKMDHIRICLEKDVEFRKSNGFENYEFEHHALPEVDFENIDCSCEFLGKKFRYPLIITGITGGTDLSGKINKNLAMACESLGIGMGLGSQRAMLENPDLAYTYQIRHLAPSVLILGNIGATQLRDYEIDRIILLIEDVRADGLAIHLNPAQEISQEEGDSKWKGILKEIQKLTRSVKFPVIAKEIGCGISGDIAKQLVGSGINAIDVSGAGGTSWIRVESYRSKKRMGNFLEWGIPTASALKDVLAKVKVPVIASGGIRTGLDVAKAICMGASLAGFALPVLKPATQSWEKVKNEIENIIFELKVCMFLVGANNLKELRKVKLIQKI
jgi:isopentenyl-diphosphate delta-isomerase